MHSNKIISSELPENQIPDQEVERHVFMFWKNYPTFRRQIFACLTCVLGSIGSGMTFGFTGTLLPHINQYADEKMKSWIAGANVLSNLVGILFGSLLMNTCGRKASLMYSNVPWLLGWLYLSFSSDIWGFLVGSALVGFSSGLHSNANVVYLVEMPEPRLRGLVSTANNLCFSFGILLNHLVAVLVDWRISLRVSASIPLASFISACFVPEMPNWLISKGDLQQAEKNFFWLRGRTRQSRKEFDELLARRSASAAKTERGMLKNIFSKKFLKACLVFVVLYGTLIGSGIDLWVYYAIDMFANLSPNIREEDRPSLTVLIDVVRLMSGAVACYLIKKVRRKCLFFISAGGSVVAMVAIVSILVNKLPLSALIFAFNFYVFIVQIGMAPISWLVMSEIFPQVARDIGTGFALTYYYILTFILVTNARDLVNSFGMPIMFAAFAVIVTTGSFVAYFILPETKKCTLQQVEDMLRNKK